MSRSRWDQDSLTRGMVLGPRRWGPWVGSLLLGLYGLVGSARAEDDWQLWLDADYGGKIQERTSLRLKQGFRWKEDMWDFQTYFLDASGTRIVNAWLNLGAGVREVWNRPERTWTQETRPQGDVVFRMPWGLISWSFRNRFEWRAFDDRDGEFRYRQRLTGLLREGFSRHQFRPYLSYELFLQEGADDPFDGDRARFSMGIRADPEDGIRHVVHPPRAQSMKAEAYFTYERTNTDAGEDHVYAIGFKMGVFF